MNLYEFRFTYFYFSRNDEKFISSPYLHFPCLRGMTWGESHHQKKNLVKSYTYVSILSFRIHIKL